MTTRITFYATRADLELILTAAESKLDLTYTECGVFQHPDVTSYEHGKDIFNLGIATHGSAIAEATFLVTRKSDPVTLRNVPNRRGSWVAVDQMENPDSVTFRPGGVLDDDALIEGQIATVSKSETSLELMRAFHNATRRLFRPGSIRMGPEAYRYWQDGGMLTSDIRVPGAALGNPSSEREG